MSEILNANANSSTAIATRYATTRLSWRPVLLFLPARGVFAFVAQALVAGVFALRDSSNVWRDAAGWWPVYSTLTDLLCLLALYWLLRREGLRWIDLFGAWGTPALRQLFWAPVYLLAVLPGTVLAFLISQPFYGSAPPPMFTVVNLPPVGALYTQIVWPIVWIVTEELVYLGYLLPRLEAWTGKTWLAGTMVVLFWGLQHLAIPWLADGTYLAWRGLSATAAISLFPLVFIVGRRRLIPFIAIHYLADLSTALMLTGVIPYR